MKIILLEDIKGKGTKDSIIEVADGYGQFLIRKGSAQLNTKENNNALLERKAQAAADDLAKRNAADKWKTYIEAAQLVFKCKLAPNGSLVHNITTKDISNKLFDTLGIVVDKRDIKAYSTINTVGKHKVTIKLYKTITADATITVESI